MKAIIVYCGIAYAFEVDCYSDFIIMLDEMASDVYETEKQDGVYFEGER